MIAKLLGSLVLVALLAAAGGFVFLAVWDVPVAQQPADKELDNSRFLGKSS